MKTPKDDEAGRAEASPGDLGAGSTAAEGGDPAAEGLVCPRCGCRHFLRVVDTRGVAGGIRRRRECRNCGRRIWTREEITPPRAELED